MFVSAFKVSPVFIVKFVNATSISNVATSLFSKSIAFISPIALFFLKPRTLAKPNIPPAIAENIETIIDIAKAIARYFIIFCALVIDSFKRSSNKTIMEFENTLKNLGIEVTVRREMGSDINAACGQLRRSYIGKQKD